jgi:TonB family protein
MKNKMLFLFLCFITLTGFSRESFRPTVLKARLNEAQYAEDLTPRFWQELILESKDRFELDLRRKNDSAQGYYISPQENNYKHILTIMSVEVSAAGNGHSQAAWSTSGRLTPEQKKLIYETALGEEVNIRVRFQYNNYGAGGAIIEGKLPLTVVPDTEASYPGGSLNMLKDDVVSYVNAKNSGKKSIEQNFQATVKFTVDENGMITNPHITTSSTIPKIDRLLLEALRQLPKWKAAENKNGLKVKQSFKIAFGGC